MYVRIVCYILTNVTVVVHACCDSFVRYILFLCDDYIMET